MAHYQDGDVWKDSQGKAHASEYDAFARDQYLKQSQSTDSDRGSSSSSSSSSPKSYIDPAWAAEYAELSREAAKAEADEWFKEWRTAGDLHNLACKYSETQNMRKSAETWGQFIAYVTTPKWETYVKNLLDHYGDKVGSNSDIFVKFKKWFDDIAQNMNLWKQCAFGSYEYCYLAEREAQNWKVAIEDLSIALNYVTSDYITPENMMNYYDSLAFLYVKQGIEFQKKGESSKGLKHIAKCKIFASSEWLKNNGFDNETNPDTLLTNAKEEYNANHYTIAVYLYEKAAKAGNEEAKQWLKNKPKQIFNSTLSSSDSSAPSSSPYSSTPTSTVPQGNDNSKIAKELYNEASDYLKAEQYEKAFPLLHKAANMGLVDAQSCLGLGYGSGIWGFPKDSTKAVEWYTKAAEQGDADSQTSLGVCYRDGDGVKQDYAKAAEWLSKAANKGHLTAIHCLEKLKNSGKI